MVPDPDVFNCVHPVHWEYLIWKVGSSCDPMAGEYPVRVALHITVEPGTAFAG